MFAFHYGIDDVARLTIMRDNFLERAERCEGHAPDTAERLLHKAIVAERCLNKAKAAVEGVQR